MNQPLSNRDLAWVIATMFVIVTIAAVAVIAVIRFLNPVADISMMFQTWLMFSFYCVAGPVVEQFMIRSGVLKAMSLAISTTVKMVLIQVPLAVKAAIVVVIRKRS